MRLPVAERSALVDRLMRSLDDDTRSDRGPDALAVRSPAQLRRRVAEIESGQVQGCPWQEVDVRMRKIVGAWRLSRAIFTPRAVADFETACAGINANSPT